MEEDMDSLREAGYDPLFPVPTAFNAAFTAALTTTFAAALTIISFIQNMSEMSKIAQKCAIAIAYLNIIKWVF